MVLNLPESPHTNTDRVVRYGQHSTKLSEAKISTSGGKPPIDTRLVCSMCLCHGAHDRPEDRSPVAECSLEMQVPAVNHGPRRREPAALVIGGVRDQE